MPFEGHHKYKGVINMNMELVDAISNAEKIDALMYAIERSFFDIEVVPADAKKANYAVNVFYSMWDIVKNLSANLEQLEKDERAATTVCPPGHHRDHNGEK